MSTDFYDVIIPKEFEIQRDGVVGKKTIWNTVGMAWKSKTSDALNLELFLFPGQRYVIKLQNKPSKNDDPATSEVLV